METWLIVIDRDSVRQTHIWCDLLRYSFPLWLTPTDHLCIKVQDIRIHVDELVQEFRDLENDPRRTLYTTVAYTVADLQWLYIKSVGAWKNDVKAHVVLPGTHHSARCMRLNSWHLLQPIANSSFVCLFVEISYQARFCLQISYPAILFTMLMGFLNRGSFIIHAFLPGTSKAFTLSVYLPGARVHIVLPGT